MASTTTAEEKETVLLIHIGKRINVESKLVDYFLEVSPEEFDTGQLPEGWEEWEIKAHDRVRVYSGKLVRKVNYGAPGSTFAVPQQKGTHSVYFGEARYKGLFPNEGALTRWQIASRGEEAQHRAFVGGKKDKATEFEALVPFRQAYVRAVGLGAKAAVLAVVVAYITGGKVPREAAGEV